MTPTIPDPFIGVVLDGKYRIEAKIGIGGFGAVYRATHLNLNRSVAVKVLHSNVNNATPENLERFRQEGVSACTVSHPNAVSILDFSITPDGYAYLVMELLDGKPLSDELIERGRVPLARCAEIVVPVCDVLTEAHASDIIHRDIKPDNIFLHRTRRGEIVKVLDFGIAKLARASKEPGKNLTATGILMGTPEYMAPERMRNKPYDGRSDVYSLGIVLYQMLTGRLPFESLEGDFVAVMWMQVNDAPPPMSDFCPSLSPEVEKVIFHALEKDPAKRPNAEEFAREFIAAIGDNMFGFASGKFTPALPSIEPTPVGMEIPIANGSGGPVPAQELLINPVPSSELSPLFDLSSTLEIDATPLEAQLLVAESVKHPFGGRVPPRNAEKIGEIGVFPGHHYPNSLAFSPDGQFFLSARRDQTIGLFSSENGKEISRFATGRMFPVRCTAISPDNRLSLFSGGDDSLRLRDAQSGGELRRLFGHSQVTAVGFSPDGRYALTGGQDRTVRLWESGTGREVRRFSGHADEIASATFSPDGKMILVMTVGGDAYLWRTTDGNQLLHLPPAETTYDSLNVAISDDRQRLIGGEFKQMKAGESENRRRIKRLDTGHVTYGAQQAAFAPDGTLAASVSLDSTIRVWDPASGYDVQAFIGHGNHINSIAFSFDGKRVLSGSDDRTVRLWDVESGHQIHCFQGHSDKIHHVAFHADGGHALSCSQDGTVRRWGLPE